MRRCAKLDNTAFFLIGEKRACLHCFDKLNADNCFLSELSSISVSGSEYSLILVVGIIGNLFNESSSINE